MLPKNIYKQHKAVITGFINGAKKNKLALGEYMDKHYFFDDIRQMIFSFLRNCYGTRIRT